MSNPRNKTLEKRILAALATGQKHKRMLCDALGLEYTAIDGTVSAMVRRREIVAPGTAWTAGYRDINKNAWMYSLPGQALVVLPAAPTKPKGNGSGVVAGRIEARDPKPLKHDAMQHMRLNSERR